MSSAQSAAWRLDAAGRASGVHRDAARSANSTSPRSARRSSPHFSRDCSIDGSSTRRWRWPPPNETAATTCAAPPGDTRGGTGICRSRAATAAGADHVLMLPGFAGHLISEAFLEGHLRDGPSADPDQAAAAARARRHLAGWRRTLARRWARPPACARCSPLAQNRWLPRSVSTASADVAPVDSAMAATLRGGAGAVDPARRPLGRAVSIRSGAPRSPRPCGARRPGVCSSTARTSASSTRTVCSRGGTWNSISTWRSTTGERSRRLWTSGARSCSDRRCRRRKLRCVRWSTHPIVTRPASVARCKQNVLAASTEVLAALVAGRRPPHSAGDSDDAFEQALTIVYRLVFLLFAEARALVPVWHPVYRESYSLDALRTLVEGTQGARGLWDALRAIARLAHAGCRAGDLRVTPFNGRLFAPARTPLAERRDLDDEAARRAVLALSTRQSADRRARTHRLSRPGRRATGRRLRDAARLRAACRGRSREPRDVACVALGPDRASARRPARSTRRNRLPITSSAARLRRSCATLSPERILQLRIVDPSMGSGAFLVAACRYLAGAYEAALVRSRAAASRATSASRSVRRFRRTIAERCLYGVDLNPMAVQLARLSLWLTTLAADRPLSFLDHRLQVGDSLLGAWLSALSARADARRAHDGRRGPRRLPFDEPAPATRCARRCRSGSRSSRSPTTRSIRCARRNGRLPP